MPRRKLGTHQRPSGRLETAGEIGGRGGHGEARSTAVTSRSLRRRRFPCPPIRAKTTGSALAHATNYSLAAASERKRMDTILIVVIVIVLLGGGGFWYRGRRR